MLVASNEPHPKEYLYVNSAIYHNDIICKIGRTNNPAKRIAEFNNGLFHLRRNGYIDCSVVFTEFFIIPVKTRDISKIYEMLFLKYYGHLILPEFGREVLRMAPDIAAKIINDMVGESA